MKRPAIQADREKRIDYEAVVDAYDEIERAMGWYYYIEGLLNVPFAAKCVSKRSISALSVGQEVQVISMADEEDCMHEVFVNIKHGRSELSVPLSQLECLAEDLQTSQAVADWHYWVARGYQY
jgi:Calcium binding